MLPRKYCLAAPWIVLVSCTLLINYQTRCCIRIIFLRPFFLKNNSTVKNSQKWPVMITEYFWVRRCFWLQFDTLFKVPKEVGKGYLYISTFTAASRQFLGYSSHFASITAAWPMTAVATVTQHLLKYSYVACNRSVAPDLRFCFPSLLTSQTPILN